MPSTGLALFTMTRDQMITSSLRALRVLQEGAVANSQQIADASIMLNAVIKKMQSDGLLIWTYQQIQVPCQENKNFYTIGPVGADVIENRPLRMIDGSFIRNPCNASQNFDTPLRLLPRLEYLQLGNKFTEGTPNSVYYDQQFNSASNLTSPSIGWGTVYVYTNPINSTSILFLNFQRQLFDMNTGADEFDFPSEGFLALRWSLAEELMDDYEVPMDRCAYVANKAKRYRDDLEDWAVEEAPQTWTPDWALFNRRAFR